LANHASHGCKQVAFILVDDAVAAAVVVAAALFLCTT
jgi:hypothetical protein